MLVERFQPSEYIPFRKYKHLVPANPVIIDCGAHVGVDTLALAKIKNSTVHAFEAAPHIFQQLKKNTSGFKNIFCYEEALGNKNGKAIFHISAGGSDGSSSLLAPKEHLNTHPEVNFNESIEVKVTTLDDWALRHNIKKVDLLWLDMQGAEQMMLNESVSILPGVQLIHSEVSMVETYEGVKTYLAYKKFLEEKGFEVLIEAIPAGFDMGNVLFKRK